MSGTLLVDAELARSNRAKDAATQVAVAILLRISPAGRTEFFLTTRPPNKAYAGYWEFAGGKLERGETVEQALVRELREELGLEIAQDDVHRWRSQRVDYPHALVDLHFCQIWRWKGEPKMLEGQEGVWQAFPLTVSPILPGALPVLAYLEAQFPEKI